LKLLARRDHTRRELLNKASRKEYTKEVIQDALRELDQKGYLNEESFAEKFITDKFNLNQWGPIKIQAHLLKKGVGKTVTERSLDTFFEDQDLRTTFLNLVLKRKRRFLKEEDLFKRKKKIFDYLHRKGFKPDSIFSHLEELMKAVSE
jgi:regulatory protein